MYNLPSPRLKKTLRFFADCGADAIINHHTHCISGYEIYNSKPIFYSLGNFVFDSAGERDSLWNYGMAVKLHVSSTGISYTLYFLEQFNRQPALKVICEEELPFSLGDLNKTISNDQLLHLNFKKFVQNKEKMYQSYLEPIKSRYYQALRNRGILPSLWNERKRFYLKNLISCESHREIVLNILEEETGPK